MRTLLFSIIAVFLICHVLKVQSKVTESIDKDSTMSYTDDINTKAWDFFELKKYDDAIKLVYPYAKGGNKYAQNSIGCFYEEKGDIIMSACQGDETAFPYTDQKHGLFTYCLLKKLQQDKGMSTLQELYDYVKEHVNKLSVIINNKKQTPTIIPSQNMNDCWQNLKLN